MKPVQTTTYLDTQLPVILRPPTSNVVLAVGIAIGGIGLIAVGSSIFFGDVFGDDPSKIYPSLLLGGMGLFFLQLAARTLTTKVQLNSAAIVYRNLFVEKSLAIRDIVSITRIVFRQPPIPNAWVL